MRVVTILDTSVASDNLGDQIIMDAVRLELSDLMPDAYMYTLQTHDNIGRPGRKILKKAEFSVVGGTNILSSRMLRGAHWHVSPLDLDALGGNVVLMGVGWRDYQREPSAYAAYLYKNMLSKKFSHSCRDQYTLNRVAQFRSNSINTACPTMWRLSPEHCARIPTTKADSVVTALTFYRPQPDNDRALLNMLRDNYSKVHFWVQQEEDLEYLRSLGRYEFNILSPNVDAYNDLLKSEAVDFIGSRLHGGIRALQYFRRSLIIAVDNRAREIGSDTGLPVVERDDHERMKAWVHGDEPTSVHLPLEGINTWRQQFG